MEEKLVTYFSMLRPLSQQEQKIIIQDIRTNKIEKGTILLKTGQPSLDNYFALKGCVRQFHLIEGEERTTNFYTEEDWILPAIDSASPQGSDYFLECVDDCVLVIANEQEST